MSLIESKTRLCSIFLICWAKVSLKLSHTDQMNQKTLWTPIKHPSRKKLQSQWRCIFNQSCNQIKRSIRNTTNWLQSSWKHNRRKKIRVRNQMVLKKWMLWTSVSWGEINHLLLKVKFHLWVQDFPKFQQTKIWKVMLNLLTHETTQTTSCPIVLNLNVLRSWLQFKNDKFSNKSIVGTNQYSFCPLIWKLNKT